MKTNTRARYIDKKLIVGKWLILFRYADTSTLSMLLQQNPTSSSRFISKMITNRCLMRVKTKNGKIILHIGPTLYKELSSFSKRTRSELVLSKHFSRIQNTYHHLSVQKLVIYIMRNDQSITPTNVPKNLDFTPDAYLERQCENGIIETIVVEMETTSKNSPNRIYHKLNKIFRAIQNGQISSAIYGFDDEPSRNYYENLFYKKSWPMIEESFLEGKKVLTNIGSFAPDENTKCKINFITFKHQNNERQKT